MCKTWQGHAAAYVVNYYMQDPVAARLKSVVDDFKELMPLVEQLGNPALQARHWQEMFTIIGADVPSNEMGTGALSCTQHMCSECVNI